MRIDDNGIQYLKKYGVVRQNDPLSGYTTFHTGGPADILIYPDNTGSLAEIVAFARNESCPLNVIGGGSNLLVGDRGIRGIVIRMSDDDVKKKNIRREGDTVYCDATTKKHDFIEFSTDAGLAGFEFMAGIPGCIGGGIMMNAGTDVGSFADILDRIVLVCGDGSVREVEFSRSMSSYRKMNIPEGDIVAGAFFRLRRADNPEEVKSRVESTINERKMKHPLDFPSAGSVFKNPEGYFSWRLINDAGLKGRRIGGAMVSEKHTNFIINAGGATSWDIRELIDLIREEVRKKFGIFLEPEVKMLGEF